MANVVIIGAGAGGLAAAIRLGRAGHAVQVLEAGPRAGGKIGRASHEGVTFDTGPSVLTLPEVALDLCEPNDLELLRHDHVFDYRWPDGAELSIHFEPEATLESAASAFGATSRDQLAAFLAYAEGIWSEAAPVFVYGDAPTVGSTLKLGVRKLASFARIDPLRTMEQGIRRHVREPHLVDVLMRYATYNGSDPRRAPATLNCIAHVELNLGCYGVRGGMYALVEALERAATGAGVEFRYDTPVRRIETRDGAVTGVATDDGAVRADAVIANADVAHVFGDLLDNEKGRSRPVSESGPRTTGAKRGRAARAPERRDASPSTSGWTAVLKAARRPGAPHTVLFPAHYPDEFRDLFDRRRPPQEPTVYVCAQERAHACQAWPDHEPLFVMANAPADPTLDADALASFEGTVVDRLHRAGIIVDSDEIVWRRTPAELARQFPGSDGSIYGAASNSTFSAFQRPANRCPSPRGLYLASGSAHPGGGVPLCLLSGVAAARAVLDEPAGS